MAKGYNIEVRKKNKYNRILNIIRSNTKLSRSQVKEISGYSMTTVLNAIEELLEQGLIIETGIGESQGGRRPIWLEINPQGGFFIGIEFYAREIFGVVMDFAGEIIFDKVLKLSKQYKPSHVLDTIKTMVNEMLAFLGDDSEKIFGIGMGVPGQIDKLKGTSIEYGHISEWHNVPIKDEIEATFNIPTYIENNAKVMALAHKWLKYNHQSDDFLFLCIRSGISMACMLNNQLYLGKDNNAGEIAHFALLNSNRRCYCGKTGCLEMEASNNAIISKIREGIQVGRFSHILSIADNDIENIDMDAFIKAIKDGCEEAIELSKETSIYLGYALAAAVNILNPNRIIIWGDITSIGELFLEQLKESIKQYALSLNLNNLIIGYSPWGKNLGAIGAASLIMQKEFDFTHKPL